MKNALSISLTIAFVFQNFCIAEQDHDLIDLIHELSLKEKVGQLVQIQGDMEIPNNQGETIQNAESLVANGQVGSFLNVWSVEDKIRLQKIAIEHTAHGIPLMFAMDVIHGMRTIFPVPLAEAASWDMQAIERSARIAAIEATAQGLQWTFAPMVDIGFDSRWGRVMEGGGEDPYLGSLVAQARVRGFQGDNLAAPDTLMATAKHFAGYGQVMAGREYNQTVISRRFLHDYVLPPFKAAKEAGCLSFMSAFSDFDGVPCTANSYLLRDVLKGKWGFEGLVVSDWDSVGELINWGTAENAKAAAQHSIQAGTDIDMMSLAYLQQLERLVAEGTVNETLLDDAVYRVLNAKKRLGLFEDPFRYFTVGKSDSVWLKQEHRAHARDIARKSMVLLRNDEQLLPLDKAAYRNIAVIGPIDQDPRTLMGNWQAGGRAEDVVTVTEGLKQFLGSDINVRYSPGVLNERESDSAARETAVRLAEESDLVILTLGEGFWFSGENTSLSSPSIPQAQIELAQTIHAIGKPVVCVLISGRPLVMEWIHENLPTVLLTWIPGTEAGNAIADVLFGAHNPGGKLPITFPQNAGQLPMSYLAKNTGRPYNGGTGYKDVSNDPAYPFGYGLSYTTFEYSPIRLDKSIISPDESIKLEVDISNTGNYDGEETVQLYVRDVTASVTLPLKRLRSFQKVFIPKGDSRTVHFSLSVDDLKFWNAEMQEVFEPGSFEIHVGTNSRDTVSTGFEIQATETAVVR